MVQIDLIKRTRDVLVTFQKLYCKRCYTSAEYRQLWAIFHLTSQGGEESTEETSAYNKNVPTNKESLFDLKVSV